MACSPTISEFAFLSYIDTLRDPTVNGEKAAILLMNNCWADVSDDVIRILAEARVGVINFAPHTTQIFQVLDLTPFGVLKRRPRYERVILHGQFAFES
jgi:hypothetical protein